MRHSSHVQRSVVTGALLLVITLCLFLLIPKGWIQEHLGDISLSSFVALYFLIGWAMPRHERDWEDVIVAPLAALLDRLPKFGQSKIARWNRGTQIWIWRRFYDSRKNPPSCEWRTTLYWTFIKAEGRVLIVGLITLLVVIAVIPFGLTVLSAIFGTIDWTIVGHHVYAAIHDDCSQVYLGGLQYDNCHYRFTPPFLR